MLYISKERHNIAWAQRSNAIIACMRGEGEPGNEANSMSCYGLVWCCDQLLRKLAGYPHASLCISESLQTIECWLSWQGFSHTQVGSGKVSTAKNVMAGTN